MLARLVSEAKRRNCWRAAPVCLGKTRVNVDYRGPMEAVHELGVDSSTKAREELAEAKVPPRSLAESSLVLQRSPSCEHL